MLITNYHKSEPVEFVCVLPKLAGWTQQNGEKKYAIKNVLGRLASNLIN